MFLRYVAALALVLFLCTPAVAMDKWLPVPAADLAMKDYPASPGAHAIILYKEVSGDGAEDLEENYVRIKIFTEEGRKYGNIEIPYLRDLFSISGVEARTIRPDGTIVKFEGQVFDKLLVKQRKIKVWAKTFSLPEVQPGCIIEYRYTERNDSGTLYSIRWNLQEDLFVRQAKFSLRPYRGRVSGIKGARLRYLVKGLSPERGVQNKGNLLSLEVENLPAFEEEPSMPPEPVLKRWILFYYGDVDEETPELFWVRISKNWYKDAEGFLGGADGVAQEVARVAPAGEAPEVRLRKLYARVQQIRNLTYEPSSASTQKEREKLKENQKISEVLQRGYGTRTHLNRLFAGMARAAGFQASMVRISTRHENFFAPALMDTDQFPSEIVEVTTGSEPMYLDPGTAHCPFGLLPWEKTAVQSLRLTPAGGDFMMTPYPKAEDTRIERKASLHLGADGSMEGTLRVSYHGQEALERRHDAVDMDEVGRRKTLEEEVKAWLPPSAAVELVSAGKWDSGDMPLEAEFKIKVPDLASTTGQRVLLPLGVFQTTAKHPFPQARRVHPVYFSYPYQELDDVDIQLPSGFRTENLPAPKQTVDPNYGSYHRSVTATGSNLRIQRKVTRVGVMFTADHYALLRFFYDKVHSGDEDRAVLQSGSTTAGK